MPPELILSIRGHPINSVAACPSREPLTGRLGPCFDACYETVRRLLGRVVAVQVPKVRDDSQRGTVETSNGCRIGGERCTLPLGGSAGTGAGDAVPKWMSAVPVPSCPQRVTTFLRGLIV
jgi:hypothetical protein